MIQLLGTGHQPEAVADNEIESIRRLVESFYPIMTIPFTAGQKVVIDHGPFQGMEAIVQRLKSRPGLLRVIIAVELLGRSVAIEMDSEELRAAA